MSLKTWMTTGLVAALLGVFMGAVYVAATGQFDAPASSSTALHRGRWGSAARRGRRVAARVSGWFGSTWWCCRGRGVSVRLGRLRRW